MRDLRDKVAVVTGGGAGIGRALAHQLAAAGSIVAVCDLDPATAKATATEITSEGGRATAHAVDVSSEMGMRALVDEVLRQHTVVDIVVNNAGIACMPARSAGTSIADFRRVVDVNLWGAVHGSVLFLPLLLERPEANLVNVASYASMVGLPSMAPYSTSKFGLRGFTEALQMEYASNPVTVTLVCPGATRTSLGANSPFGDESSRGVMQRGIDEAKGALTADAVAAVICKAIRQNRTRVLTGRDTKALDLLVRALPKRHTTLLSRKLKSFMARNLGPA